MATLITLSGILSFLVLLLFASSGSDAAAYYKDSYLDGVVSYYEENWPQAIESMQKSLKDYNAVRRSREICHTKYNPESSQQSPRVPEDYVADDQIVLFHSLFNVHACQKECEKVLIGDHPTDGISHKIEKSMNSGRTYNYLQFSLFKENKLSEAATFASTHLYLSPLDSLPRSNVQFYKGKEDVPKSSFKSLVKKPYRDLFEEGLKLYNEDKYEKMTEKFEQSLSEFYKEVEKCRNECQGPTQFTGSHEFSAAMWKVYSTYLECKYSCPEKLGNFREFQEAHFFGSYFHYLTYGYYHINKISEAAKAYTTQKRIEPKNKIVEMNGAYIKRQPGVTIKDFVEREDAKALIDELEKDKKLLQLIKELHPDEPQTEEEKDDEELLQEDFLKYPIKMEEENVQKREEEKESETKDNENAKKLIILETASDHGGVERLVVDGLLNEEECQELLELAKNCKEGDGYQSGKSPHTPYEKFAGLTVIDAAKAAVRKEVKLEQVALYLNTSKLVKHIVAEQFNLNETLHFSFTHLVCRTAKDSVDVRDDLSHPVHADNCVQQVPNGECIKKSPAYTWRDYSAILYLNDAFEGGKFFFAHSPFDTSPQHYVLPKCGRMVGFSAGKENMHGVTAVTKGMRCAVALWFTLDPRYKEESFVFAETLLSGTS